MRGLRAALYKDRKLVLNAAGLLSFLLSFALLPALLLGMSDLSKRAFVQPFPVAVRDLDQTMMSRSLIAQMAEVELFSEVRRLQAEESDEEALRAGAAAVLTIPKDFFYAMYTAADCPVLLALNSEKPLEAALLRSIFSSVMDIISSDQAAWRGVYRYAYGDPDEAQLNRMYEETSKDLFLDALGRQNVFSSALQSADAAGAMRRRLTATLLSMLTILFAAAAVKTFPEELSMGIPARFRAAGGRTAALLAAKFLTAGLEILPVALFLALLSGIDAPQAPMFFLLTYLLLFAAFGPLTAVSVWTRDAGDTQRIGNLYLLFSLFLGGTFVPRTILPQALSFIARGATSWYAALSLNAMDAGLPAAGVRLWGPQLFAMGAAGIALTLPGFYGRRSAVFSADAGKSGAEGSEKRRFGQDAALRAGEEEAARDGFARSRKGAPPDRGTLRRLLALLPVKLQAAAGGFRGLFLIFLTLLLTGMIAHGAAGLSVTGIPLAVCDLDESAASRELTARLSEKGAQGLRILQCTRQEGELKLLTGEAEGLFTIGKGYEERLLAEEPLSLQYESTASAFSAQGVREVIAGQAAAQKSRIRAAAEAEALTGTALTAEARARLNRLIDEEEARLPALYVETAIGGAVREDPFLPGRMSFAALALLLVLLTAASFTGGQDARCVERRLLGRPFGGLLSFGGDFLSLALLGVLSFLVFLLPGGVLSAGRPLSGDGVPFVSGLLPAGVSFALAAAALSLLLVRLTAAEGRVDMLAPFLSLLICLLGGCFLDLSTVSETFAGVFLLSPAGLAARAANGSPACAGALLAECAVCLYLGRPRKG